MICKSCEAEHSFWSALFKKNETGIFELAERFKKAQAATAQCPNEILAGLREFGQNLAVLSGPTICENCQYNFVATYSKSDSRFTTIVRGDFIRGFNIEKAFPVIKISEATSPSEYEDMIKMVAVLLGANAIIKSNWFKESERYQAGTGPKGNPYYQSRSWFWGEGTPVVVSRV